jgi:hypothetical protein
MMHVDEPIEMVNYLGREVQKRGFRAFIYSTDGKRKIAESWDEFELFTHSDTWFATPEEAKEQKKQPEVEAPKNSRKKTEG